jgi:hypothetical protein
LPLLLEPRTDAVKDRDGPAVYCARLRSEQAPEGGGGTGPNSVAAIVASSPSSPVTATVSVSVCPTMARAACTRVASAGVGILGSCAITVQVWVPAGTVNVNDGSRGM